MHAILYVDGGCSGNMHKDIAARVMSACVSDEHGTILVDKCKQGGSNNIAELWSVVEALTWCAQNGVKTCCVYTDSRNSLSWANLSRRLGKHLNDRRAVELLRAELGVLLRLVKMELVWLPRDENVAGRYLEERGV